MIDRNSVAVYGASGHTGAFVVAELVRRGLGVVAVGREMPTTGVGVTARTAALDDASALDRALLGCGVVINCAGPFLDTAAPVLDAALRNGCHYIDVTAEQASALATFAQYDAPARLAGVAVIPAAGFYGGLADLLATVLVRGQAADTITIAIALDRWWPTKGTRKTGERNTAPRLVVENGELVPMKLPAEKSEWSFGNAVGVLPMETLPFSEMVTISHHLNARSIRALLNATSLGDVRSASTPEPTAIDAQGRSAQQFFMDVVVETDGGQRRGSAIGQDIYAVTAPLVAEAAQRMLTPGFSASGALALGQAFAAGDFLAALDGRHLAVRLHPE